MNTSLNILSEKGGGDFSIHPVTLGFYDKSLERHFQSAYFQNNLQLGRACHLIAIFFFSVVGIWDAMVIDSSRLNIWIWVITVVSLFFLSGLASSFFAIEYYARFWRPLYAFYVLLTGSAFTVVSLMSPQNYPLYNFVGIIFCLIFCYTFIRLTFLWALVSGNAIVFIYFAGIGTLVGPSETIFYTDLFYIFGINLLGVMVCYSLERMARRDFVLNYLLEQARKETNDLNTHLEQMVMERTRELQETLKRENKLSGRLIQAQKMESVGRLAGGVAHDYNNISTAIIGYTELVMEKLSKDDPAYEDLQQILQAAKRATAVTRQLLAFARKQTIAPKVIDLNHTIESMHKILGRIIGEDVELEWMPGERVWPVKIDPSQVDQVLANLCVNSRDAISDTGRVTIETKNIIIDDLYCQENEGFKPGEFAQITVSDTGKGIAREDMDKIFEPFFTTKGIGQGTGLGLATVYGIVKQNQGFINVYSEKGQGTTINIYLPRCSEALSKDETRESPVVLGGKGECILLVEDDVSILGLEKRMLERLGYTVLSAGTPGEAIEMAESKKEEIALLVTDVVMPEMNGRELAERLESICPGLKIIFTSGYTANVIAHRGVIEKGVNFISKPFSRNDFAAKIRSVLDSSSDDN